MTIYRRCDRCGEEEVVAQGEDQQIYRHELVCEEDRLFRLCACAHVPFEFGHLCALCQEQLQKVLQLFMQERPHE